MSSAETNAHRSTGRMLDILLRAFALSRPDRITTALPPPPVRTHGQ
jgi:hypothetical protein